MEENTYLGDGVYASFDGYQIWLAADHHDNKVVALEPAVLVMLLRYIGTVAPGVYCPNPFATRGL